jgi:hypothetical protein
MKPASTEQRLPESSWSTTERWCMIVEMEMLFGSRLRTQVLVARRPRSRVQARNRLVIRAYAGARRDCSLFCGFRWTRPDFAGRKTLIPQIFH